MSDKKSYTISHKKYDKKYIKSYIQKSGSNIQELIEELVSTKDVSGLKYLLTLFFDKKVMQYQWLLYHLNLYDKLNVDNVYNYKKQVVDIYLDNPELKDYIEDKIIQYISEDIKLLKKIDLYKQSFIMNNIPYILINSLRKENKEVFDYVLDGFELTKDDIIYVLHNWLSVEEKYMYKTIKDKHFGYKFIQSIYETDNTLKDIQADFMLLYSLTIRAPDATIGYLMYKYLVKDKKQFMDIFISEIGTLWENMLVDRDLFVMLLKNNIEYLETENVIEFIAFATYGYNEHIISIMHLYRNAGYKVEFLFNSLNKQKKKELLAVYTIKECIDANIDMKAFHLQSEDKEIMQKIILKNQNYTEEQLSEIFDVSFKGKTPNSLIELRKLAKEDILVGNVVKVIGEYM